MKHRLDRSPFGEARRSSRPRRGGRGRDAVRAAVEAVEARALLAATPNPSADAFVGQQTAEANYASANFGADNQLRIAGAAADTADAYLTFSLSGATSVGSALLQLVGGAEDLSQSPNEISVFAVSSTTWVEGNGVQPTPLSPGFNQDDNPAGEIRWTNRPSSGGAALGDPLTVDVPQVYEFDVTDYVQAQRAAGASAVSFVLRSTGGIGVTVFGSKESADKPMLAIDDDTAAPTASAAAADITTSGGTTHTIAVTYADEAGINAATIDVGDIAVTGPGGALTVTGVSVNAANPEAVVATYTVSAPGGAWDPADNGTYTVAVQAGAVQDFGGNAAAGGGSFAVAIPVDVTPPVAATFTAGNVTAAGATTYAFTVGYTDNVALNAASIDGNDVTVAKTGGGSPLSVIGVTKSGTGAAINATYTVAAPGGSWDTTDNGTYAITVVAGNVRDANNNGVATATRTFTVSVPDTNSPGVTIAPVPAITTAGVATTEITVTYADNQGIDASTIDAGDLSVVQDGGSPLAVTLVSRSPTTNAASVVAVYAVAAPGGFWNNADNGSYTVSLAAGAVKDTSGNNTPLAGGSFEVNIVSTVPVVDPTFNGGNPVSTGFVAEAVATDAAGRVLVAGRQGDRTAGTSQSVLQRLNADGSLDTFFAQGGLIVADVADNDGFFAVAVDEKGRAVAAGFRAGDLEVRRYDAKGRADRKFGQRGVAVLDLGGTDDAGYAVAALPGGGVLVAGTSGGSFALARFDARGRPDRTFGTDGVKLLKPTANPSTIGGLAVRPDGTIYAAGTQGASVVLMKLDGAGNPDAAFGSAGVLTVPGLGVRTDLGSQDRSVGLAVGGDGKLYVGNGTGGGDFGVRRYNADGAPDLTFDGDGLAAIDLGGADDLDYIGVQGTGQVLLAGTTDAGAGVRLAVAALKSNGTLDGTFSAGGKFTTENAVAAQSAGTAPLALHVNGATQVDGKLLLTVADGAGGPSSSPARRLIAPGSGVVGSFGTVNGRSTKLAFLDADGTKVTLSLKGGTGQALYDGNVIDLVLTGTTARSAHSVSAKGGDRRATVRDVRADGALRSFSGKAVDVVGTFYVNGDAAKLTIGSLSGTLATAGSIASLSVAGNVNGAFVLAGAALGSDAKVAGTGDAADAYNAARLGKLSVGGSMAATFVGAGVNPLNGTFGDAGDTAVGGATSAMPSVSVKGGANETTVFAAGAFGKAKIPQRVEPTLDPHFRVLPTA